MRGKKKFKQFFAAILFVALVLSEAGIPVTAASKSKVVGTLREIGEVSKITIPKADTKKGISKIAVSYEKDGKTTFVANGAEIPSGTAIKIEVETVNASSASISVNDTKLEAAKKENIYTAEYVSNGKDIVIEVSVEMLSTYTLNFNTMGGNAINPVAATSSGVKVDLPTPEKAYNYFTGWYTDMACSKPAPTSGGRYVIKETTILYAGWSPLEEISVKWNGDKTIEVGQKLDTTKIVITAKYKNGKSQKITSGFNFTTSDVVAAKGTNQFEIEYGGLKAIFTVEGKEPLVLMTLTADYKESTQVINSKIDPKKLTVTGYYNDGTKKKLTDYTLSPDVIATIGVNTFYVFSGDKSTTFQVMGVEKSVTKLKAVYVGKDVLEGQQINQNDIIVTATFNDGTEVIVTDYMLSTTVVTAGVNTITVTYGNQTATFNVKGAEKTAVSLTAMYTGSGVIEGNEINRNDITVNAYFNDGSYEVVSDYKLSSDRVTAVGMNAITVTYQNAVTTIYVVCNPRLVTSIQAVYKGPNVEEGSSFNKSNVVVEATYNDKSTEAVTDFNLANTLVSKIGMNTYTVTYGGQTAEFEVRGVAKTVTGTGTLSADVYVNDTFSELTANIDGQICRTDTELTVESYEKPESLKSVVRRITKSTKYIPFDITMESYDYVENQYLPMRITIPDEFDATKVAVYYTPNKKTILAKMSGGLVDSHTYEFYAYRDGCYILVECNSSTLADANIRDKTGIKPFILVSGMPATMEVDDKVKIEPFLVNGTENSFVFTSDDSSVVMVNQSGTLTALSEGYATITVATKDGKMETTYEISVE